MTTLKRAFEEKGFDGFLVTNEYNVLYFAGIKGPPCLLIPSKGENTLFSNSRDYEQAKAEGAGVRVELVKRGENLMTRVAAQAEAFKVKRIATDALSHESFHLLSKELRGKAQVKVQDSLVWDLRKIKDGKELELMRKAGELTSIGVKTAYEVIRAGMTEIEAAAEIEYAMRKKGSWGTAFETSVAAGPHSAFPHGGCSETMIRKGDFVVIDVGAKYCHYCSDVTRTIVAGKPSAKQEKLYKIVKTAQDRAFEAIRPKARAKEVDTTARKVIEEAGYGGHFIHGLGHGVGLEVHEPPSLSQASKERLTVGNVVTNEPGIYLVGYGGVRIEDTVLVQKTKAEKLTSGPYTLSVE